MEQPSALPSALLETLEERTPFQQKALEQLLLELRKVLEACATGPFGVTSRVPAGLFAEERALGR